MIKSIHIKNYQSHKDTELEFSKGVNIIIGISESGKTAILRAFRWLKDNTTGFGFLRDEENSCSVNIKKKKVLIQRYRGDKGNCYIIENEKGSLTKFEAMKGAVPKDVKEILNLSDINVQDQFDPYFVVLDSPGNVAKTIGDIIGLDEADRLIRDINKDVRDTNTSLQRNRISLKELREELKRFKYLDEYEDILKGYIVQEGRVCRLREDVDKLDELIKEYIDVEGRIGDLILLTEDEKELMEEIEEYNELKELLGNYYEVGRSISLRERTINAGKEYRKKLLKQIKNCPVCEQEIDDKERIKILEYYK